MEENEYTLNSTSEIKEIENESNDEETLIIENKEEKELDKVDNNEETVKESEEHRTIKTSIQQIRELAEKYEENAREAEEASSYCTSEDLSFAGVGMEEKIIDCSMNYREMAQRLYEYADSLEASLNEIK